MKIKLVGLSAFAAALSLAPLLAHAEDDPRLGEPLRRHAARVGEEGEGTVVPAAGPRQAVEPGAGLEIVIQDSGPGVDDDLERCLRPLEVR